MTFLEEIAQRIDKALDGDCGYGVGGYLADQIAPLIAAHDAKVRAETLREARDNVRASSFWADGSDNYADRVRGYLSRAADRIEKEAGL